MHADQAGGCPRCRTCYEILNQAVLFRLADTALSHSPFDTPQLGYLGQPLEKLGAVSDHIETNSMKPTSIQQTMTIYMDCFLE